jgi:hypothetical protein
LPGGLEARVKAAAEADGGTVNAFIVAAIEEKLERRGSTTPAGRVAPPAVTFTAPLDSPDARRRTGGTR